MQETYNIKLPLFEGPMDLLLHLIREQKIDIYDIPIAHITRQYLEYVEMMKELNLDIAGEFLVMAATLIHIKSRMLLPVEETADTEEPEDPRMELVMKLLEYQAFKEAALGLKEREEEWTHIYSRTPMDEEIEEDDEDQPVLFDLNLFDLLSTFQKILEQAPEEVRTLSKETLTIKDKMNLIIESLQSTEAMRFEDLFKGDIIRSHFIVTFIAFLELIRLGLARVYQEKEFGRIWVISPESKKDFTSGYRPPLVDGGHSDDEIWHQERSTESERKFVSSGKMLPRRTSFPILFFPSSCKLSLTVLTLPPMKPSLIRYSRRYPVNMRPHETSSKDISYWTIKASRTDDHPSSVEISVPAAKEFAEHVPAGSHEPEAQENAASYSGNVISNNNVLPSEFDVSSGHNLPSAINSLPSRKKPF